ncbi:hypothetical protein [Parasphingorhabdus cellanae]|uniref:Uncharacterized protein n=1 Tax=Parasphingorhabdus cellanae TaxID=2806553 RepID=A0ABX7T9B2_9SPHN|nr:hypothetical protein [Parasphingorhabdus cellanae]QTD57119.1 hypothetical protein J4G78_06100 [Parasphingorhabdus cellanae]
MRPTSIIQFERFYLGALGIGLVGNILNWDNATAMLQADPNVAMLGSGFLVISTVVGLAISLLLWFLAARKAVGVAKWIITIFFAIGLISIPFSLGQLNGLAIAISLVTMAMQAIAVYMLFRPDAKKWFAGEKTVDLEKTFE